MANIEIKHLLLRYRVASVSTLILGIALSTLAFVAADSRERSAVRRTFDDAAANVAAAITLGVQHGIDQVESLGALFDSANDTSHAQFDAFALQLLTRSHGIQALEWVPRVPSAMRDSYEKAMLEAVPGFEITEHRAQGQLIRAGERAEYFPVYLVEPEASNKAAIGFDLGSDPARLEALTRARDTGKVVATARITLVQEAGTQYGFRLFRPVYRSGLPRTTDEQRHDNLLGFALGVFRAGGLIDAAAAHLQPSGIKAVIYDDSAPAPERLLASWPAITQDEVRPADQPEVQSQLQRTESINIGGRSWRIELTPTKQFFATMPYRPVWMPLLVGSLLTMLLAVYIEAARKHLREELESREGRLAAEAELTNILGSIDSILMSVVPGSGELIYANRAAERIFGQSLAQLSESKKLWIQAVQSEDREHVLKQLSLPLEKDSWSDEIRIVRPDGEVRWLGAKAKSVHGAHGKTERIDIVASDITEQRQAQAQRKEAEDARREAELRLRAVFEQAPVGIVIIGLETGLAVEFNDIAHNQLGYSREEFARLKVSDYEAVESPEEIRAHMDKILRQGKERFDTLHRTKSGELRNVHIMMRVLDLSGQRYFYCIYQDVTEQKTGEAALERSNRALRTLSAANEELVRATSESELLQAICRVIVEKGGYHAVGVCYRKDDLNKSVTPMAWAGAEACCIAEEIDTWADTKYGQRPLSRTIRSGKPEVDRDIFGDPTRSRWSGAELKHGYASVLALPLSDRTQVFGGLCVYASEPDAFNEEETQLLGELANDLAYGVTTLRSRAEHDRLAYEHVHHEEILRNSLEESIQAIADTVEMRDPYTAGHQRRVGELAIAIAQKLGLPEETIHGIRLAASVHDLGKINVPAEILAKPGKLSNIEIQLMRAHAQAGYDILKDIKFPWPIATIVWQHHERLDGSGYPQGLKGEQILPESRIMAVADVVEAMASHRPYRPSLGMEATLAEIERGRGSAYDPAVVDACLEILREGRFAFTS